MLENWVSSQWQRRGSFAWLLFPLSLLYQFAGTVRRALYKSGIRHTYKAPVPVIVVGNIYIGGTGKTPVILSLATALRSRGWHPGLVSRGYGSATKKRPVFGRGSLDSREFGDEPSMISAMIDIPVSVHPDRPLAVKALLAYDPAINVILSDDGLQHWALGRDIEILVQDERGCGNGLTLPAGPLREPVTRLTEVDAILTRTPVGQIKAVVGHSPSGDKPAGRKTTTSRSMIMHAEFAVEIAQFRHLTSGQTLDPVSWRKTVGSADDGLLAVAGIGVPERFFANLRTLGIYPTRTIALADHAGLDIEWLGKQAESTILMTEKDAVKLSSGLTEPGAGSSSDSEPGSMFGQMPASAHAVRQADNRIWVASARTIWCDESFFEWLDHRLRHL